MSMIRSRIGTDPEVLRHHPLAQRVAGAECRDQFSRPFSSMENYFLLTFPLIEREGGPISLGPRLIWKPTRWLTELLLTSGWKEHRSGARKNADRLQLTTRSG